MAQLKHRPRLIACILAGGLSSRMGRDKARLRLGARTLLAHVRAAAGGAGWPVKIIRRDDVPRCGPLGGILTGLRHARAEAVVFLACDMPFVSPTLLKRLARAAAGETEFRAAFVVGGVGDRCGFPFLIPRTALALVEQQQRSGDFSMQSLAALLKAERVRVPAGSRLLRNANTPEEFRRLTRLSGAFSGGAIRSGGQPSQQGGGTCRAATSGAAFSGATK